MTGLDSSIVLGVEAAAAQDAQACAFPHEGGIYLQACVDHFTLADQDVLCLAGSFGRRYASWLVPEARERLVDPLGAALDEARTLALRAVADRR